MTRSKVKVIIELDDILREHLYDDSLTIPTALLKDAFELIIQGLQEIEPPPAELLEEDIVF